MKTRGVNRPTLSSLLAERTLRRGEAVTVLAPLLQTLSDLHGLDCTHGSISADSVVFDDTGRPTFGAWQHCVEHRRGDMLAPSFRPAMLDDCRAFVELAELVLSRTRPAAPGTAALLADALSRLHRGRREPFVFECENAVFALGEPEPVGPLEAYEWGSESSGALASVAADVDEWQRTDREAARARARVNDVVSRLRAAVVRVRRAVLARLAERGSERRPGRRAAKARLAAVTAVVCVGAVAGALFVVPTSGQAGEGQVAASPSANVLPSSRSPGVATSAPTPVAVATGATSAPDSAALAGDDSVAAAAVLWRLRAACLRLASEDCLAGVDQVPSAALDDDRGTIAAARSGPDAALSRSGTDPPRSSQGSASVPALRLVQAVGATALIEVASGEEGAGEPVEPKREPASLFLVKGEAGWRIREMFTS